MPIHTLYASQKPGLTVQLLIMNSQLVIITLYDSTEADKFPEEFLHVYKWSSFWLHPLSGLIPSHWCWWSSISKSLSDLFNKSIITGMLPTDWKFARVVPIPKSGCSKDYRPISILTIISKLLEKHIHNRLLQHLNFVSPLSAGADPGGELGVQSP